MARKEMPKISKKLSFFMSSSPERHQLKPLIDDDSAFVLSQSKRSPVIINSQICIEGSFLDLIDPTHPQYAAYMNKPNVLAEFFRQWAPRELKEFITPRFSNTKRDLFDLALSGHSHESFMVILNVVAPPGQVCVNPERLDFIGPGGHSPLWVAVDTGNWEAARLLFERIGDPKLCLAALLRAQKTDCCPLVQGLRKCSEDVGLKGFEEMCKSREVTRDGARITILQQAIWYTWWTDDFRLLPDVPADQAPDGKTLWELFNDVPVAQALREFADPVIHPDSSVQVTEADKPTGSPVVEAQPSRRNHCPVDGCCNDTEPFIKCTNCGQEFCADHIECHGCP
jgi:hypothetical protein